MTSKSFNLIDSPWIPVVMVDGKERLVGLKELFDSSRCIADLSVRPEERVALMRLLMCISYASQRGKDWASHLQELENDAIDYLAEWHESFWLHHDEKPFLQIAGLRFIGKDSEKLTPLSKLDFALASGNNSQLNDHGGVEIDDAKVARGILVCQCFSPGGLISPICWNGNESTKNSIDAPCIPSGMLHAFLRGRTLKQTLRQNLPSPDVLITRFKHELGNDVVGEPVWEMFPQSFHDSKAVLNATRTLVGRLVPLSRAILIKNNGMILGEALQYPSFNSAETYFPEELSATVRERAIKNGKKELKQLELLKFNPDKAAWREMPAFLLQFSTMAFGRGPLTLSALFKDTPKDNEIDVVVVGVCRDKASIKETAEMSYPIRPKLLTEIGRQDYEFGLKQADLWAGRLGKAMETMRSSLDEGWDARVEKAGAGRQDLLQKLKRNAYIDYWTVAEQNIKILFDAANSETDEAAREGLRDWSHLLQKAALKAYQRMESQLSGRHRRAYILGLRRLIKRKGDDHEK